MDTTKTVGEAMMPWTGHLAELRVRLIRSFLVLAVGVTVGWYMAQWVLELLRQPVGRLIFVAPAEAFMAYLQIALILGIFLASPWILWEAWFFVRPGLTENERRFARKAVPFAYLLFLAGAMVGYRVLFPIGVRALLQLASGPVTPAVSVARYLGVFWSTVLPCALAFELPLVVIVSVAAGFIDLTWLKKQRSMAFILSFVIGGMISSQGIVVQALLAVPLFVLFEISMYLAGVVVKKA